MYTKEELHQVVDSMVHTRVLVIGDVMLDMYEHCIVKRISPEAPVPIAKVTSNSYFLGGAGNVASNVRALGATASLISVIGDDSEGILVQELLKTTGIGQEGIIVEPGRITTQKKRILAGTHQLIRIDREITDTVNGNTADAVCTAFRELVQFHDVVIISDYCKGLLTDEIIACIKAEAHKAGKKIFVDSKDKFHGKYSDVYLIKPNRDEAEHLAGEKFADEYTNLEVVCRGLSETYKTNIVVTLGSDGIAMYEQNRFMHKTTRAQQVFDVSGAGDTVLAVIATAVAAGADLEHAVDLSNHAAGYVVSQLGTSTCDRETLRQSVIESMR